MGFWNYLFKSKEEREAENAIQEIYAVLNDDSVQLRGVNSFLRDMLDAEPKDKLSNAIGEFGRDPRNPILCNGPLGEITYLSRLVMKTQAGLSNITFHRIGSAESPNTNHTIDIYEIIDYEGLLYDVLFLDFYHTTKSTICPCGYVLEEKCIGFRGINSKNNEFPRNQYELTRQCAEKILGIAIVDTDMKNLNVEQGRRIIKVIEKKRNMGKRITMTWWE